MTKHTNSNLPVCPDCGEPFKWDDVVIFVDNVDAYYHEKCVNMYPISYLITDKDGDVLGTVDTDANVAFIVMNQDEYTEDDEDDE